MMFENTFTGVASVSEERPSPQALSPKQSIAKNSSAAGRARQDSSRPTVNLLSSSLSWLLYDLLRGEVG